MKATVKTSIMLIAMTIGTLAASAQSARRGTPHSEQNRRSSHSITNRPQQKSVQQKQNNKNRNNVTARSKSKKPTSFRKNSPAKQEVTGRSSHSKTSTNRSSVNRGKAVQPDRSRSTVQNSRKTSTTTRHNPRSDYRSPRNVHTGKTLRDPKYDNRGNAHVTRKNTGSSSGHRHYYPAKKVKVHVHPNTYHNHYKVMYYPSHRDIIWTSRMHRYYINLYPGYNWRYPMGYNIRTISVFDARYNIGEVSRVYGRVYATWYNKESDDLLLFFGGEFPNQAFSMVVPGHIARRFSWRPEKYFLGQHVFATGLITSLDRSPEMIIKKKQQLDVY